MLNIHLLRTVLLSFPKTGKSTSATRFASDGCDADRRTSPAKDRAVRLLTSYNKNKLR